MLKKLVLIKNKKDFTFYHPEKILDYLDSKDGDFWLKEERKAALSLFHRAAYFVPAYRDFLQKHKVDPDKINTYEEFVNNVPIINKKNYLREYPYEQLLWSGNLEKHLTYTATSGSTGKPFYFPRRERLEMFSSMMHEAFFENSTIDKTKPTLVIIGFGMGIWIGGLITYKAFEMIAQRTGYPISIITPGVNKAEVLNALQDLAPKYHQTILVAYPPLMKDIIDEALARKINLKKLNIKTVSAAEAFSEKFRDYIVKKAGIKNFYLDQLHIYGSADIGSMAWETPTSILIKRLALKNKELYKNIFGGISKSPTFAQYNPLAISFEEINGEIILTGDNAMPLIRYAIGDNGGVKQFNEVEIQLKNSGISLEKEAAKVGIKHIYKTPFVYVYERNDFSTTLYGLQIYPEVIRDVLINKKFHKHLTGKFTMTTAHDKKQNQYLEIHIELKKEKQESEDIKKLAAQEIFDFLRQRSSEFRELSNNLKERCVPKIVLWPAEHPKYFKVGIKQKWVEK